MSSESVVQAEIRLAQGLDPTVRMFRNNRGQAWMGNVVAKTATTITIQNPRPVLFGLTTGASDLIGLKRRLITPGMVGQFIAQFAAQEIKVPGWKPKNAADKKRFDEQIHFLDFVNSFGGVGGVVHSPDESAALLK